MHRSARYWFRNFNGLDDYVFCHTMLHNLKFVGGCNGNLKGICSLVEGMDANEVISKLEGIRCGFKSTSCPDQLAKAIKEAL